MKVERWDTCDFSFTSSKEYENPFTEVELTGTFTHNQSGEAITVNGFYDGGLTWRIRFMLTELGEWHCVTKSNEPGLDGKTGEIMCIAGQDMVFLSKDYNLDAFGCPVLNEETRKKLENMGEEVPEQYECEKKEARHRIATIDARPRAKRRVCCPNSENGRIYRVKRKWGIWKFFVDFTTLQKKCAKMTLTN